MLKRNMSRYGSFHGELEHWGTERTLNNGRLMGSSSGIPELHQCSIQRNMPDRHVSVNGIRNPRTHSLRQEYVSSDNYKICPSSTIQIGNVQLPKQWVFVDYIPRQIPTRSLKKKLSELGYTVLSISRRPGEFSLKICLSSEDEADRLMRNGCVHILDMHIRISRCPKA